jgi:hypothetical protein
MACATESLSMIFCFLEEHQTDRSSPATPSAIVSLRAP